MKLVAKMLVVCCVLAVGVSIPASVASGTAPVAETAKKKCKKGKGKASAAKKSKCKKGGGGSDIGKATALFAGSSFSASGCTSTSNCNRSFSYALAFCKTGTYAARFELNDSITGSTFVDRASGTWKFTSANAAQGTGNLAYTVDSWQSDAGSPQPQGQQNSSVVAQSATSFLIDGTAFTRSPGGAGC